MSIKKVNNRSGFTIWLTGLSGAGKTTIAERLVQELHRRGRPPEVLDGDIVRTHLSKGLGFSKEDRDTNIRRIAFVSSLVTRQGGVVVVAAISPYRQTRDEARQVIGDFVEVYVECPLDELVRRDVKGLYAKALRGEIANFTGVSDPYEAPLTPEVVVSTDRESIGQSVAKILAYLEAQGYVPGVEETAALEAAAARAATAPLSVTAVAGQADGHVNGHVNGHAGNGQVNGHVDGHAPDGQVTVDGRPQLLGTLGQPHGGRLAPRQATPEAAAAWRERIARGDLPSLRVTPRTVCDLELLGNGAFSPLPGFLGAADYRSVVREVRLASGLLWSIPIVLGADESEAATLREGQDVALLDGSGEPLAVLHLAEKHLADLRTEAREVYRTEDEAHPGVRAIRARGPVLLAGPVTVLRRPDRPAEFTPYRLDPAETRRAFAERGWRSVVAFQTRNPVHRAHEYLLKTALESVDGLLLHPLVGETKDDDIPASVRLRCYEVLLEHYFPRDRVVFSVLPAAMHYAGPREAIHHALMRKNYGCTHFIVGRDHAGVGTYYGTYDAQRIFEQFAEADLGIRPVFFEHSFYCVACGGMASAKTCSHGEDRHISLSGTKVRSLLSAGIAPPPEFSRPEVAEVLIEAARATVTA